MTDYEKIEKVKKPAKVEHLANWFFGNFCVRCGRIDDENENHGKICYDKILTIANKLKQSGMEMMFHKEFSDLIRTSTFCKPTEREFHECKICKALGVPQWHPASKWR